MAAVSGVSSPAFLEHRYSFFYMRRDSSRKDSENYASSIIKIGSFDSVNGFFGIYDHLVKPSSVPAGCVADYHLFREGITPTWEDPRNKNGGKWIMRLRKTKEGLSSLYWEELLLSIIGEDFGDLTDHICGAVVSIRANDDIVCLWNADANDSEATNRLRDLIREKLDLPQFISLEYKRHSLSRNHVWRAQNNKHAGDNVNAGNSHRDRNSRSGTSAQGSGLPRSHHHGTGGGGGSASHTAASSSSERDWSTLRSRK